MEYESVFVGSLENSTNVSYNVGYMRDFEEGDRISFYQNGKLVEGVILEINYSKMNASFKVDMVSTYTTVDPRDVYRKVSNVKAW